MHYLKFIQNIFFQMTVVIIILSPELGLCEDFPPFRPFRGYSTPDLPPFSRLPPKEERPFSDIPGFEPSPVPDLNIRFKDYDDRYDTFGPPQVTLPPYAEPEYLPFGDMRPIEQPPLDEEVLPPFRPMR